MTALLEARGVSRDFSISRGLFAGKRLLRAVVDLDVTVETGEVLGIVGESGSGKSTFGYQPDRPCTSRPRVFVRFHRARREHRLFSLGWKHRLECCNAQSVSEKGQNEPAGQATGAAGSPQ